MKLKSPLIAGVCLAAIALCGQRSAIAATKKSTAADSPGASASPAASASAGASASPAAAKAPRAIPFRGKVSAVDSGASTFTIAGKKESRVFKMTDKTKVTKGGAAATMVDITADAAVSGSYWKQADGTMEAKSVKISDKAAGEASDSKKKSKKTDAATTPSPAASASPSASAAKK
ncbi:MAG: hypothetical protein M3Y69_05780 [Verrucomicrobiota bacterium]|nr:hypothetical protein [Verrucomicrobiota bacterium]